MLGSTALGDRGELEAFPLGGKKVRVDGLLREWPARLTPLAVALRGSATRDPKVEGMLGYDDKNLYVVMKVVDRVLVRTKAKGAGEDVATLIVAFPTPEGGYHDYRVALFGGDPGKVAGSVKFEKGAPIAGAKIVENPTDDGYDLEVSIPWSAFKEARTTRSGLRAALRYDDADQRGRVGAIVATHKASRGGGLPPLRLEAEYALVESLKQRGVATAPSHQLTANIAGDGMFETVAVYGSRLTMVGPRYRGGTEFFFQDLGLGPEGSVLRFERAEFTGDAAAEVLLVKRVGTKKEYREVLEVLSVSANGDAPFALFTHELAVVSEKSTVRNALRLTRHKGKPAIEIAQDVSKDVDPGSYDAPLPANMAAALMPWDSVKRRTFAWTGEALEKVDEEITTPKMQRPAPGGQSSGGRVRQRSVAAPPPPRPPSPDELMDRVYALYRKDRAVGRKPPTFDFVTDVSGTTAPERVLIHGQDIVAFGKEFKAGTSYVYITVGVKAPEHIIDVTALDLTGDGKAEVVVRGVIEAQASKQLGGDVIRRHGVFVYKIREGGIERIFAAETGRTLGDDSILGGLRFIPDGDGYELEVRSIRAIGWDESSYRFPTDRCPYGGLEPLLLPWSDLPARRYRYEGTRYVLQDAEKHASCQVRPLP